MTDTGKLQTTENETLIVENVSHTYSGESKTLDNLSFSLGQGKRLAIVGPSGCGKSTLLRLLCGLEPVQRGEIRLGRQVLGSKGLHLPAEKRPIGLVFQDYALFPHMTALENVLFAMPDIDPEKNNRFPWSLSRESRERTEQKRSEAREYISWVGLSSFENAQPTTLSGGQKQRLALARALAHGPQVLLLDEPFSGLDRQLRESLRKETSDILKKSGRSAILVTHDIDEAIDFADHIMVMRGGQVEQFGTRRELYNCPKTLFVAELFGDVEPLVPSTQLSPALLSHLKESKVCMPDSGDDSGVNLYLRSHSIVPARLNTAESRNGIELLVHACQPQILARELSVVLTIKELRLSSGATAPTSLPVE